VSVSGGISGRVDSQEALCKAGVVDGASRRPSSTPGVIGKASNKRAERAESRGAGAPRKSNVRKPSKPSVMPSARRVITAPIALALAFCLRFNMECDNMVFGGDSTCAKVGSVHPQASLQVALHVTKRHDGATASNRVSVSGGISGRVDSQEALCKAGVVDGALDRWSGRINTSEFPT
jgi:hypothetical protein